MLFLFLTLMSFAEKLQVLTLTEKNSISFSSAFSSVYIAQKQQEIGKLIADNPGQPYFIIVINSPGGSVQAGSEFFTFLKGTGKKFHTLTLFAASMGFQMVQNLDTRFITPTGVLMSHRASFSGLSGQSPGELETRIRLYKKVINDLDETAAKRAGMSLSSYKKSVHDELWMYGKEAVDKGFADKVIVARCDSSMFSQHTEETITTMFGSIKVKKSKCPLVTAPIDLEGGSDKIRDALLNPKDNYYYSL